MKRQLRQLGLLKLKSFFKPRIDGHELLDGPLAHDDHIELLLIFHQLIKRNLYCEKSSVLRELFFESLLQLQCLRVVFHAIHQFIVQYFFEMAALKLLYIQLPPCVTYYLQKDIL